MSQQVNYPAAPIFGVVGDKDKKSSQIYLDDIFDEFLFAADRSNFDKDKKLSKDINSSSKFDIDDDDDLESLDDDSFDGDKKRKRSRGIQRNMTEEQKVERR